MHGRGESYRGIVPTKQPNESVQALEEAVEGRTLTKEGAADKAEDLAR